MRRFLAVALAAVLLLTLSGTALAAKGGNGNSTGPAWITLSTPLAAAAPGNPTIWPGLGTQVNFSWGANVKDPRIEILCYQDTDPSGLAMFVPGKGYLVYGEARGATPDQGDYMGTYPFVLGGGMSAWLLNGGSASCVANLFYFGKQAGQQTYNWLAATP